MSKPLPNTAGFRLVAISSPVDFAGEHDGVEALFAAGLVRFHLRKPAQSLEQVRRWLLAMPAQWHPRIVVHRHSELAGEFSLAGFHGAIAEGHDAGFAPSSAGEGLRGVSLHSLNELAQGSWDYAFLSPVFPSLSKSGYAPTFSLEAAALALSHWRHAGSAQRGAKVAEVLALGGVEAGKLRALQEAGFDGAAVLGALWNDSDPLRAWTRLRREHALLSRQLQGAQ